MITERKAWHTLGKYAVLYTMMLRTQTRNLNSVLSQAK